MWLLSPGRAAVCAVTLLVLAAATLGEDGGQGLSSTGRWAGAPSAPQGDRTGHRPPSHPVTTEKKSLFSIQAPRLSLPEMPFFRTVCM